MDLSEPKEDLVKKFLEKNKDIRLNELYKMYFCKKLKDYYDSCIQSNKWKKAPMKNFMQELGFEVDTKLAPGYIRIDQFKESVDFSEILKSIKSLHLTVEALRSEIDELKSK